MCSGRPRTAIQGRVGEYIPRQAGKARLMVAACVTLMRFTLHCPATAGRAQSPGFMRGPYGPLICAALQRGSLEPGIMWSAAPAAAAVCHTEIAPPLLRLLRHEWWPFRSPQPSSDQSERTEGKEKPLTSRLEQSHGRPAALKGVSERSTESVERLQPRNAWPQSADTPVPLC